MDRVCRDDDGSWTMTQVQGIAECEALCAGHTCKYKGPLASIEFVSTCTDRTASDRLLVVVADMALTCPLDESGGWTRSDGWDPPPAGFEW